MSRSSSGWLLVEGLELRCLDRESSLSDDLELRWRLFPEVLGDRPACTAGPSASTASIRQPSCAPTASILKTSAGSPMATVSVPSISKRGRQRRCPRDTTRGRSRALRRRARSSPAPRAGSPSRSSRTIGELLGRDKPRETSAGPGFAVVGRTGATRRRPGRL